MGLLDYYRQFEDMDESEVNKLLRERRAREKALALEIVPVLDLSGTEWPEFPNPEVVNASVYTVRGRINGYPDREATPLRRELAERHNIKQSQIVIGNGVGELLQSAAHVLLSRGDEMLMPWPSYFLYPTIALRTGARPVQVGLAGGHVDPQALLRGLTSRTRAVVLANPNDPTGTYLEAQAIGEFLSRLPSDVQVLLDEAYIQFQDVEPEDAAMQLVEAFPNLLVFRTFSKIYGLSGLRAGYVIGSPAAASLLGSLGPVLGVNVLTQAAVLQALRVGDLEVALRRRTVIDERARIAAALDDLPVEAPPTEANFVWLRADGMTGAELAARLEQSRVVVADGASLGGDDYVRAAIRDTRATNRLVAALTQAVQG